MIKRELQSLNSDKRHDLLLRYQYSQSVNRVARGFAHDFNNIFSGLLGQFTMLLQQSGIKDVSPELRTLIRELLQRGTDQTDLLFDFTREHFKGKKRHSPLWLANKAVSLLNKISRLHHFELCCSEELPEIISNARDIVLVLFYLGENAIEAMEDGGIVKLELVHQLDNHGNSTVNFTITDDGIGFSDEILVKACEPFATTKSEERFAGLGLYAAQSIVDDHAGVLEITNREKGGASVKVKLPSEPEELKEGTGSFLNKKPRLIRENRMKYTFLVVDDEEGMRKMLLNRLQRRGHIVFCAESCKEAVEEFRHLSDIISVVLLDVGLKDATGHECADELHKINSKAIIIFMSGKMRVDQNKSEPDIPFLKKPFSIEQVEEIIRNV